MNKLERYLAITVIRTTLLTLLILTSLLLFLSFVDEMDDVGKGLYGASDAFLVALATVPRFAYEAFPIAALIGSLLGLGMLANHSELVAMRAAGFSLSRIIIAVLKSGLLMLIVVLMIGEFIAPSTEQFAQQYRNEKQNKHVTLKTKYGFWAKDGQAFINIRTILPGGNLKDIYIYEFNQERKLYLTSHATSATYQNGSWLLENIQQTELLEDKTVVRKLAKATWNSILDPEVLNIVIVKPTMLPIWGLYDYIDYMEKNGQSATNYSVAFWTKIATPLATLVMLFLAIPFILGNTRMVSAGQRIVTGIFVGAGFILFSKAMSYLSIVYDFNPFIMALLPSMIFSITGYWLLKRVF